MRLWIERAAAILLLVGAGVTLWFGYELYTRPTELKVAVGPSPSPDHALLTGLARRSIAGKHPVHLKVVPREGPIEAAQALERGEVDLAVIRGDLPVPGSARAIVVLQKSAVIVIASNKNRKTIEKFAELKGRKLGVVGSRGANDNLIDRLSAHHGLAAADITRMPLAAQHVADAMRTGRVDAVLGTGPLTARTIASFNAAVAGAFRGIPAYIDIDAEALAKSAPEYESDEIPAGAFRSSPANPEEDLTTLFFTHMLVAKSGLDDHAAAALTRQIFESRVLLQAEFPNAKLIQAASTDKDALIPVHPGAAAYYDGSEKNFLERYSDALFYGPMLLSLIGTGALAAHRYLTRDESFPKADRLARLRRIAGDAAHAPSAEALANLEDELIGMFDELVAKLARGGGSESEIATSLLVFKHVSDILAERRRALGPSAPKNPPPEQAAPAVGPAGPIPARAAC